MRNRFSVLLILLSCGVPAAFAQSAPPAGSAGTPPAGHRHPPVWTLDANHDGMLSRDELQSRPGLLKRFDEIDANHDGYIDRNEWRAWHQAMKAQRSQRVRQEQESAPAEASSGG